MRTRLILLDLEQTLIPEWGDWTLTPQIDKIVAHCQPKKGESVELGLMSWAVYHNKDVEIFKEKLYPALKDVFGQHFLSFMSMDQWANCIWENAGIWLQREELFDIYKKEDVLFRLARNGWKAGHDIELIDDAVHHQTRIDIPRFDSSITFFNPWNKDFHHE